MIKEYIFMWILVVGILTNGCSVVSTQSTNFPENINETPEVTETEEFDRIPTSQPEMTSTIENKQIPTSYPEPTLSFEESKSLLITGLSYNILCKYPCFLDQFEIGKTNQEVVEKYIYRLGNHFTDAFSIQSTFPYTENNEYARIFISDNSFDGYYYPIDLNFRFHDGKLYFVRISSWPAQTGEIKGETIYGVESFPPVVNEHLLPNIMEHYGVPDEVFISTYNFDSNTPFQSLFNNYSIILSYPGNGILIEYVFAQSSLGDFLMGCSKDYSQFHLLISAPERHFGLQDYVKFGQIIGGQLRKDNLQWILPIDQVTNLTIEEFYNTFKNPSLDTCVMSKKDLWPLWP